MIFDLVNILATGLRIWDRHDERKYLRRVLELKMDLANEMDKPIEKRNIARCDRIERELLIIGRAFVQYSEAPRSDALPRP